MMTTTLDTGLAGEWLGWRADREQGLRDPYGWLSLAGLHWLDEQARTFDGIPGAWSASPRAARVTATADEGLIVEDLLLDGTTQLSTSEGASALFAEAGGLRLELLRRDGRYAIRVRDPHSPALGAFSGVSAFAYDPGWVVPARFVLFTPPPVMRAETAQPGLRRRREVVGELRVELGGTEYALAATAGRGSDLSVAFTDATRGSVTAPWRTLAVRRPRAGRAVLDFNRALNPPSAFTPFGTCIRPPAGNALPFAVEAGERAPS
ncbi:DUF1684 domain-containing protein [Prauserella cavernicola]|uniref:DUF1684 domain-containing protein n=1 Tax=Prauserella cavernicola TaxID=2800127 RepID=A0A934QMX7_9PSEU|nr:DUF1684 domain-containing protein [Prauserella cavernicola]MBK1782746.1 DUF1684 domain-containing protein [Prauserella cavernicola]